MDMGYQEFFKGRSLLIVTKHGKENVIAPILESYLSVSCDVTDRIDTDTLGTFSGEIEREDDAATSVRKKCHLAYEAYQADLIIASEGSFFPHPIIPFLTINEELLFLKDYKNDFEIMVRSVSTETNYSEKYISSILELNSFLPSLKFPTHALILSDRKHQPSIIFKAITNSEILHNNFNRILSEFGSVFIQADMRACFNPSRMKVIEETAEKLAKRAMTVCPLCGVPGFGDVKFMGGLPCAECSMPTRSVLSKVLGCNKCHYEEMLMYPEDKKYEDPMYCDYCNP